MPDDLQRLLFQAAALVLAVLVVKLGTALHEHLVQTVRRLRTREPEVHVGDAHQCRYERVARENRDGVEWVLKHCKVCDHRYWSQGA